MRVRHQIMVAVLGGILSAQGYGDESSDIGYPTPEAALEALKKNPGAQISVRDGWTIVSAQEESNLVMWSFAPGTHPAYPAAVKRTMVQKDGAWYLQMKILCGGSTSACDNLAKQFNQLNEQIKKDIRERHGP